MDTDNCKIILHTQGGCICPEVINHILAKQLFTLQCIDRLLILLSPLHNNIYYFQQNMLTTVSTSKASNGNQDASANQKNVIQGRGLEMENI